MQAQANVKTEPRKGLHVAEQGLCMYSKVGRLFSHACELFGSRCYFRAAGITLNVTQCRECLTAGGVYC